MTWDTKVGKMSNGEEWEKYAHRFLRLRHRDDQYQEVPARFGGDLGIESFTRATGQAYQCYLPEDDYDAKALYEHQRDKVTRDLRKLETYEAELKKVLGTTRLGEWNLVTPRVSDKELLAHCAKKTAEVRKKRLPFIKASFKVLVRTEADYEMEIAQLFGAGVERASMSVAVPEGEAIASWLEDHDSREAVVAGKARAAGVADDDVPEFVYGQVEAYLLGQALLEEIRSNNPELYDELFTLKNAREAGLRNMVGPAGSPGVLLQETLKGYESDLAGAFERFLSLADRTRLAQEVVADWLIRCPLRFPRRQ